MLCASSNNWLGDLSALRAKVGDLGGSAKAMFRFEALDLSDPDAIADAVRHFDIKFGPLSHLFVVCGMPFHLKEHPDAWKLVGRCIEVP
jgi:NAD(P)-dependent dehydrogenase (short-subunit alcohol dehydrogenase family)